jgi:hypothetical protein
MMMIARTGHGSAAPAPEARKDAPAMAARKDAPPRPRTLVAELVDGVNYRVQFWTDQEWDALPEHRRPGKALRLDGGGGWCLLAAIAKKWSSGLVLP